MNGLPRDRFGQSVHVEGSEFEKRGESIKKHQWRFLISYLTKTVRNRKSEEEMT